MKLQNHLMLLAHISVVGLTSPQAKSNGMEPTSLEVQQIEILKRMEPRFPGSMQAIGVTEGTVSLVVALEAAGAPEDVFILQSTRPEFTKSALKSLEHWEFSPANFDGVPIRSSLQIDLSFAVGEKISWQFIAIGSSNVPRTDMEESPVTAAPFDELDQIPLPLEIIEPDSSSEGTASIEFYIDETGRVRCPRLVNSSSLDFAEAMLEAVSAWTFEPPMVAGQRTNTTVRQNFSFQAGKLTAQVH